MLDLYYISFKFSDTVRSTVSDELAKYVSEVDLYYSSEISHIQGSVVSNLHMTCFYGLTEITQELELYVAELNSELINSPYGYLELGDVSLEAGYQDMYNILYVDVLDKSKSLLNLSTSFLEFQHDTESVHSTFWPHITLAYLKNDFENSNIAKLQLPKQLKVESISICK